MQARAILSFLLAIHRRSGVFTVLACLIACAPKPPSGSESDLQYAVLGGSREETSLDSILPDIDQSQGRISVLVIDKSPSPAARAKNAPILELSKQFIRSAVRKWNDPLVGFGGWRWPEVTVTFEEESETIFVTKTDNRASEAAAEDATACLRDTASWLPSRLDLLVVVLDSSCQRSFALPWSRLIVLAGPEILAGPGRLERTVLHEYGHIIGLGDTYDEPGYQQVVGQPNSVMQTAAFLELQSDDIAGVRALWDHIEHGKDPCAPGYTSREAMPHARFCAPDNAKNSTDGTGKTHSGDTGYGGRQEQQSITNQDDTDAIADDQASHEASKADGAPGKWIDPYTGKTFPFCSGAAVDPDEDGWGWEKNASCKVAQWVDSSSGARFPYCTAGAIDPDGDGWGWENDASCKMPTKGKPAGGDKKQASDNKPSHGEQVCKSIDLSAGPLFSNADASRVCPNVCAIAGRTWNHNWMTTKVNVDSVCGCSICQ